MKRKDFLIRFGRSFLLALLAGGSGMLIYKGKVGRHRDCPEFSHCSSCDKLKNCALPEAMKIKTHEKR